MNPQVTATPQGQTVAPAPTTVSPQGAASVAPNAAPVPTRLPTAPQIAATPGPVAPPTLNPSAVIGQIGDYYNIPRQTTALVNAGQTGANIASANFQRQQAENNIQIQNQKDQLDPSQYHFTKNADGSVTILNSLGDQVNIGTYAALTGANPAQALQNAGATDKASQQFITAYNNLQTYIQDKVNAQNGDQQAQIAVGQFNDANPGLANMELGQLQSAFMSQYGSYFGQPSGNSNALTQAGVNPSLTSQNSPVASSAYEELNYYPQLANPETATSNALSTLAPGVQSAQNGLNAENNQNQLQVQ